MMIADPRLREIALQRIEVLRRLAADLSDVVTLGTRPTVEELAEAPLLRNYRPVFRSVPCIVGSGTGHPLLADGIITTSQVFMVDPDMRWARTMSRFYRLKEPDRNANSDVRWD